MLYILFFILWLFFWSFGSVLLTRFDNIKNKSDFIKKFKSLLRGRSKCPKCKNTLKPRNLIPIISFLLQKWKCANCQKSIPIFYPILEILSGIFFVFFAYLSTHIFWHNIEILISASWFRLFFITNRFLLLLLIWDRKTLFLHFFVRTIAIIFAIIFAIQQFPIINIIIRFWFFLFSFVILYWLGKLRVKYRLWKKWEWIGEWDVRLSAIIWLLFPVFFQTQCLSFSLFNLFYYFVLRITISAFLWIILFWIEQLLSTFVIPAKAGIQSKINSNKIKKKLTKNTVVPFFPSLILWFWLLLLLGKYLIGF